ncbi:hypothetical protein EV204_105210 [Tissierella praeacuta]|uniref:hypothetical protein n=1 Tax=Tissierella praeacuta TaxID=43131 RepID=UPI00104E98D6|nr:hypothetical protein [Tissierella praeacuta]TCU72874.1 hypothetical protein EV204_105210 [Tissierella praeacuta]
MKVREIDISNALKEKHERAEDIFAAQVKIGPAGSKIMDAVAIKKTWSPRTVIGYEIKVSRQDFLSDQKHPVYMDNCNIFYFVTPKDIIHEGELPVGAGHMIYNPDTNKLRTVKKAPYRNEPISSDVLLHIMFWKMDRYFGYRTRTEILDDYKARKELKSIGKEIAYKISNLEFELKYSKKRLEILREKNESYKKQIFELRNPASEQIEGLSESDIWRLKSSIRNLSRIAEKIREVN